MTKKYITLRKLNKKTRKKEGPILFAEVRGYYFDGKNSYTLYKDARGKETMKKDKHEHTKT